MFQVCNKCNLYKYAQNGCIVSDFVKNPKIIIIGEHPTEKDDISGKLNIDNFTAKILGKDIDNVYYTTLVKCPPYFDIINPSRGVRNPTSNEISCCKEVLIRELKQFPENTVIVTLGNTVLSSLVEKHQGIGKEYGKKREISIGGKKFILIPNFSPNYISKNINDIIKFESVFNLALSRKQTNNFGYKILNYEESIEKIIEIIDLYNSGKINFVVFDIETDSLNPFDTVYYGDSSSRAKTILVSLCYDNDIAFAIPLFINNNFLLPHMCCAFKLNEGDKDFNVKYEDLLNKYRINFDLNSVKLARINKYIDELMYTVPLVGYNIKFDIKFRCVERNLDYTKIKIYNDALIMAHNFFGKIQNQSLSLKDLSKRLFSIDESWDAVIDRYLFKFKYLKDKHYGNIPTGILGEYSSLDVIYTKMIHDEIDKKMPQQMRGIVRQVTDSIISFVEAESKGIYTDNEMYKFLKSCYENYLEEKKNIILSNSVVKRYINDKIVLLKSKKTKNNINIDDIFKITSNKNLQEIIYDSKYFNVPPHPDYLTDGGKGGVKLPQTSVGAIENVIIKSDNVSKDAKDFGKSLLEYRDINTLKTRYIDSFESYVFNGFYKPEFNLTGTATGRLSSGFHTLPSKSDIKRIFISRWHDCGGFYLCADASQLEVRVGASISGEKTLINAYNSGIDVHTDTAFFIYKLKGEINTIDEVTSHHRKVGKKVNFGVFYGEGPKSLSENLGISKEEAKFIINAFFKNKPDIVSWIKSQNDFVRKHGFIVTPFNRVIPIPEALSSDESIKKYGDRRSINSPVQSAASDCLLIANNWSYKNIYDLRFKSLFLGTVHDSTEWDVYPGELIQIINIIKNNFEINLQKTYSWIKCPLIMDFSVGCSWGGSIELSIKESTKDTLVATGSGLSKDIKMFILNAQKAYDIDYKILKKEEIDQTKISSDIFIRDKENWEIKFIMKNK